MKTALIITTYNRPELLRQCFDSVSNLHPIADYAIIVDDASNSETLKLLERFDGLSWATVIAKQQRKGIKDSLLLGFNEAFIKGADLAINLDADAIVKPDFISRLVDLKKRFPSRIVSGFNCNHPKNPVLFDGKDYVERRHCNGINMCIDKQQYETIVKPALLKPSGNWDYDSSNSMNFIISKPSVVEHLGYNHSTMGHGPHGDVSCDFYKE